MCEAKARDEHKRRCYDGKTKYVGGEALPMAVIDTERGEKQHSSASDSQDDVAKGNRCDADGAPRKDSEGGRGKYHAAANEQQENKKRQWLIYARVLHCMGNAERARMTPAKANMMESTQ